MYTHPFIHIIYKCMYEELSLIEGIKGTSKREDGQNKIGIGSDKYDQCTMFICSQMSSKNSSFYTLKINFTMKNYRIFFT